MSGLLQHPAKDLALMSIYQYVIAICYMTIKSIGNIGSARVAYYLGGKAAKSAQLSAWVAFSLALSIAVFQSVILFIFRNKIGYVFSNDEDVVRTFGSSLAYVLCVYVIADGAQGGFSGVLNGMGRQSVAGPVAWTCYYLVALPISVLCSGVFGVGLPLQVLGLTIGIAIGTWLHASIYAVIVCRTDWNMQVQIATARLELERSPTKIQNEGSHTVDDSLQPTKKIIKQTIVEDEQPLLNRENVHIIDMGSRVDEVEMVLLAEDAIRDKDDLV